MSTNHDAIKHYCVIVAVLGPDVKNLSPNAFVCPACETLIYTVPRAKPAWEIPPGSPGAGDKN